MIWEFSILYSKAVKAPKMTQYDEPSEYNKYNESNDSLNTWLFQKSPQYSIVNIKEIVFIKDLLLERLITTKILNLSKL